MTIFIYSDLVFLKVLFYALMIFIGLFEAKIYVSDKKITENTLKYYIVSLSSFIVTALLFTTDNNIIFYRLIAVMIIYGIWRYKYENPVVVSVSLIVIQVYASFISLLLHFVVYLIIGVL